jgi:adenylate cyclase
MTIRIFYTYEGKVGSFEQSGETVVVGRPMEGVAVDLDLTPDFAVSRPHARIWVDSGQYWVEDLGSDRGTVVAGHEIKGKGKRRLNPGDAIQVGNTILRVEGPAGPVASLLSKPQVDSGATVVSDLPDKEGRLEVKRSIAADSPVFVAKQAVATRAAEHLALLYELPLQFAEQMRLDSLMQMIVERLVAVIPGAVRGALLIRDRTTSKLLLRAHVPAGEPSVSMTLAQRTIERREGFIWRRGEDLTASLQYNSSLSGMYAPLVWENHVLGVICVDNPRCEQFFNEDDLRLLLAVARYAAMAVANRRLQDDLQQNAILLTRLLTNFSPKSRDNLLKKARAGRLRLGGEKSGVTVLCSDIRGFTRMSATMDAEDIVEMLNAYFAVQVNTIFSCDGTVDKFVGDSVLAVFGSPEPDPKQHENAVHSALDMQAVVKRLNQERHARGLVTCDIGIGISCGEVLHGFIGSSERMEYTVIGDAVNKTARLCDGAKSGEILISPELHQHVWRTIVAQPVSIPTKHEGSLSAYRLVGLKPEERTRS